jgi:hypothetical protein
MEWISFTIGMLAGAFLLVVVAVVSSSSHHSDDFDDYPN